MQDENANLQALVNGQETTSGVEAGAELLGLAEALVKRDVAAIDRARAAVAEKLGVEAMVDSVGVVANFQRMVRIADSTGIPLDTPVLMMTQGIREELRINDYSAAKNSPRLSLVKKFAGRMLAPFAPRMLRRIAKNRGGA